MAITIAKLRSPVFSGRICKISRADVRYVALAVQWRTSGAPFGTGSKRTI